METVVVLKDMKVKSVWFDAQKVYFDFIDGRTIGSPIDWFPRLRNATETELKNWRLIAGGTGVHWEDLDEDLSAEGMLLFRK